jgi:hypothetical protein
MSIFFMTMLYHNHVQKLDASVNEKKYRRYSILLETVISNLPATLWTVDKNLTITFSRGENDSSLTELVGCPLKEYIEENLYLSSNEEQKLLAKHKQAIQAGKISSHTTSNPTHKRTRSNGFIGDAVATGSHFTTVIAPWYV